jgi:hypothetical protein
MQEFLLEWPASPKLREVAPTTLPVLGHLAALRDAAPSFSLPLVRTLADAAPMLAWRQSYREPAVSARFLQGYGYTELMGLSGPVPSEHLACGFLVLGPQVTYPPHSHEAQEIYVPLAGAAAWRSGAAGWVWQENGAVLQHGSGEIHAMRTAGRALLAVYLWRSANLAQKSRLEPSPSRP